MRFSTNKQKEKKRKRIKTVEKINSISTAEKKTTIEFMARRPSIMLHACMAWPPGPSPAPRADAAAVVWRSCRKPRSQQWKAKPLSAWNMDVLRLKRWRGGQPALHCICLGSGEEAERNACMHGQQERSRSVGKVVLCVCAAACIALHCSRNDNG